MQYTIYLGSKCNLKCPYCHREADNNETSISDNLLKYLSTIKDLTVKFMGGEPTLYMTEIKKVVEKLPNAHFSIATNGVLLSKYIDFFKKNNFMICISYDGCKDSIRGFDPFTQLLNYPYISVSCTLYHGNTDFKTIIKNFCNKSSIIGRSILFFPHIVHYTKDSNKQYALTKDDMDSIFEQYKNCIEHFIKDYKIGILNTLYLGIVSQLIERYKANYSFGETYCTNKTLYKVDSRGTIYSCQYIRDENLSENWQKEQAEIINRKFPQCKCCDVYDMCAAACIKSKEHNKECYLYKKLYSWFKQYYKNNEDIFERVEF